MSSLRTRNYSGILEKNGWKEFLQTGQIRIRKISIQFYIFVSVYQLKWIKVKLII